MKMLFLVDVKITDTELTQLQNEFTNLVKQYTAIVPTYLVQRQDYTNVPTEADRDGDMKPTSSYTTALLNQVYAKYGTYGVDSVVLLVHRDNWIYKGIWGTNWSGVYHQYHVHLSRFDNKNIANSLGTLYHEWMHSLDVLIKVHTGVNINKYFKATQCFVDYDTTCVHGNAFIGCKETPYKYIRWKENTDVLAMIAPDLREAYKKRRVMETQKSIIGLLEQVVILYRTLLNKKKGISLK
jgi:hypothetical protein